MASTYRNLVFEGGGVKGIAYGGALVELEKRGILEGIQRVGGTSAGGITATLLALGYTAEDISEIVADTRFSNFADHDLGVIRDALRLIRRYGFHKGNKFRRWIGKLIERKSGRRNLTFGQLHERSGQSGFRDLYLVGANLSQQKPEIYSYEKFPDMEIRIATRITMSIPLYYQCVKRGEDVLVDGGITWNYPLDLFDQTRYMSSGSGGGPDENDPGGEPEYQLNGETLGFRLDTREEIEFSKRDWALVPRDIRNVKDYLASLFGFLFESVNKRHLNPDDWKRTIFIDTFGVKATDFDLPGRHINRLIENGKQGVEDYFKWLENRDSSN
jgi:NTE family protein